MNKINLLIILIISSCNVISQSTFSFEFNSSYSYSEAKIYNFSNNYYLIANRHDADDINPNLEFSPILIKINIQNNEIDTLSWEPSDQNALFNELIDLGNGEIGLIGTSEAADQPGFYHVFYLTFDELLNINNIYYYDLATGLMDYTYAFINNGNNISIASAIQGDPPNYGFQYIDKILMEITQEGELIFDSIYNHSVLDFVYDFIPFPNSSDYILFCSDGFSKSGEINLLDSNYNLIDSYYSADDATVRSIIQTSDTGFISSSQEIVNGDTVKWLPSFRKYNSSFDEISYAEFGSADTSSWPALYNSISSIDYNEFYGGFTYNIDKHTFYSTKQSYFSIYSIDKDLNLNWNKFYGGDAYYRLCDITTDTDGGCLMIGTKYANGSTGPAVASLILIKVDQNGLITSTNEEESIPIKNAIITPNPGKNYLQLHTGIFPADLQMFDIKGQLILEEEINQNSTTIHTQSLSSGTYIWQLLKDGQVVETDKWVKK